MKNDLTNLLPPEVLDKTRATEKMVLGAILNHQDTCQRHPWHFRDLDFSVDLLFLI